MAQANIKAVITAEDRAGAVLSDFGKKADNVSNSLKNGVNKAAKAFGIATTAAVGFAIKSAASFEQSRVAFDTMLGSAEAGKKMMKDLSDFARRTPFELPDVVEGAKKLLAYGISAQDVMKDLQTLGDITAAVGTEKLPMLTLAFGQVATKGKLFGQEIRQFTEAGIPLVEQLAKSLGKTKEEITEMSENGEISFEQVRAALEGMTGEGGKFFGLMEKQSKTFNGVMSNVRDQIGRTARKIVGISEEGDIKEGSIFAKLSAAAQRLLSWLDNNSDKIAQRTQQIVDDMLRKSEEFAKGFAEAIKSDGFAAAITEAFITMLGKLDWSRITASAVALFVAIAPDIVLGFIRGLMEAALSNPIDFAILFGALGFLPASVIGVFAGVLGGIPLVGPVLSWVVTGFSKAASLALSPIKSAFAGLGSAAVNALKGAISVGLGLVIFELLIAYKLIMDKIRDIDKAIRNTNKALDSTENALAKAREQYKSGKISKERYNAILNNAYASGGFTGRGGVNEVAGIVHKGEYVVPQSQVDQTTGMPKMGGGGTVNINVNVGMYAGTEMEKRKMATELMRAFQDINPNMNWAR